MDARPDADPNAFPEPIFLDPSGTIGPYYAVDPTSRRAVVYTGKKFDDEVTDNFVVEVGVVGGGMPSDRIERALAPSSAVFSDAGHLRVVFTSNIDPDTGTTLYYNQPFLYDVTTQTFTRWLGDHNMWGGRYAVLSQDGTKLAYFLGPAPSSPTNMPNTTYIMNLGNPSEAPGKSLAPFALDGLGQVLSRNGHMLVFHSYDPLVPADTDATDDVYALDTNTKTLYLVSDSVADPFVPAAVGDATGAGYRIAYHEPPPGGVGEGTIVVCQLLTSTGAGCRRAAVNAVACPSNSCKASVSISPNGRWLAFGTLKVLDPVRDAGALLDLYRIDLDALFAGGSPEPRMMTPTPPDYPGGPQIRFNAGEAHMNDDGSLFFRDSFFGDGLGIWVSPAY